MEKMLNSAMAVEEMNKKIARKNEIASVVEQRKEEFENADADKRDELLNEVEELQKEADTIDGEIDELKEEKEKLEKQEERMSMANVLTSEAIEVRKSQVEDDKYDTSEYRKAWRSAVMSGSDKELRALFTINAENGTVPIPTYLQGRVETVWQKLSILNEVSIANYKGILAVPFEVSATGAVFHEEGSEAVAEEKLTLGQVLLQPVYLKKYLRVSDEVIALSDVEFMDYVADEIVYQIHLALENAVINRNATSGVIGIINAQLTDSVNAELSFNAINEGLASLLTVDDGVVVMNRKTFYANFMSLTDLQGRPIFSIATDNEGRARHFVNGARVLFTNGLPAYDDAQSGEAWAIVGDLKAYKLNLPQGITPIVLFDPYTEAPADMNRFVGRLLSAGNVVRPHSLAKLVKAGE